MCLFMWRERKRGEVLHGNMHVCLFEKLANVFMFNFFWVYFSFEVETRHDRINDRYFCDVSIIGTVV